MLLAYPKGNKEGYPIDYHQSFDKTDIDIIFKIKEAYKLITRNFINAGV